MSVPPQPPEDRQPWERLRRETTKQFNAFEIYRNLPPHKRSSRAVADALGLKTYRRIQSWRAANRWNERVDAWDGYRAAARSIEDLAAIRTMSERHVGIADHVTHIAYLHLEAQRLSILRAKEEAEAKGVHYVPELLNAKQLIAWAVAGAKLESDARLRLIDPKVVGEIERDLERQGWSAMDRWRETYICPPESFVPHRLQRAAINDDTRFMAIVAGVQSGKTTGAALAFWNRILKTTAELDKTGEAGFFWMVAPNSIVGEVMCEAFEAFAPPGMLDKTTGQASGKTWHLTGGHRVQFRSAESELVARPVHGMWLDEFTLMKKKSWVQGLRQRLTKTAGWAIFSGTPRGRNWAWELVWRPTLEGDDKCDDEYVGYTWPSTENPAVSQNEIDSARRQLPPAYFRREFEASWESFHGQIYESWDPTKYVCSLRDLYAPNANGVRVVLGVDWGFANPGSVVVLLITPNGEWHCLEEVYQAGKLPDWWTQEIARLWREYQAETVWCDPADPGRIAALVEEGIPARGADNSLHEGIRSMAALINQGRFFCDTSCTNVSNQLTDYHWKEDKRGRRSELPVSENDHAVDATRYGVHSTLTDRGLGEQVTWGGHAVNWRQRREAPR